MMHISIHVRCKSWTRIVALSVIAVSVRAGAMNQPLNAEGSLSPKLTVTLAVDKNIYKVGEPISVIYAVQNAGTDPVYIHPRLAILDMADAGFRVEVFDAGGSRLPHQELEGFFTGHSPDHDMAEYVERKWVLLLPDHFYGRRQVLAPDLYRILTRPGHYTLKGIYFDQTEKWLTANQKKALEKLRYPVWSGEATSNEVSIEIVE